MIPKTRRHAAITKTRKQAAAANTAKRAVFAFALALAPRAAFACPVCFGNSDAPMAIATNTGVLFMLGVVAVVLAGFASFFVSLIRRANRAAAQTDTADAAGLAPSEGTAQC